MEQENTPSEPTTAIYKEFSSEPPKKRHHLFFFLSLSSLFILVLGIGAIFIYGFTRKLPNHLLDTITIIPTPTPYPFQVDLTPEPMEQWQTYTSAQYGVVFKHPSRWRTIEHFKNKDALVGFAIVDPFYVVFEKIPTRGITQTDIKPKTVNGITWYQPDTEKAADKEGVFCEIYNCDEMTYGKYSSYKDGYRYTFYYPQDVQSIMDNVLTTFSYTQ